MEKHVYSFWDKVIYSIFAVPVGILLGPLVCWLLSFYYLGLQGFSVYMLAVVIGIAFTTLLSFVFPSISAAIMTFYAKS